MMRTAILALLVMAALPACTRLTPAQQMVSDAAAALGGRDRVLAARTLVIEAGGTQHTFGQDVLPDASGQTYTVTGYRRAIDFARGRERLQLTRTPNFPYFQGMAPQTQVQGLDGAVAYNVAPTGTANRIPEMAAADRRAEWRQHPLPALRAALDPTATLANPRTAGGESLVDVTDANGAQFTLAVDTASKLPVRVETRSYDTNLGDVVLSTSFTAYQEAGGLKLPAGLTTRVDAFTVTQIDVTSQSVDAEVGDLAAPAAAASAAAIAAPPAPTVTATPLAKGITFLAGGSHHSVLVEFSDHLMLIEAPLNGARAAAVIAKARELVPGKPLTQLVNTHHHFDHSGGVRTAIAEGMDVITHPGTVAFIQDIARRPHSLRADALSKSGRVPAVEGVADSKTYSDGAMTVTLYALSGPHVQAMLYAHFPKERLLVEADVYTPNSPVNMFASAFRDELAKRSLRIDRIAPLHGNVAPYAQFLKDAAAPAAAAKQG